MNSEQESKMPSLKPPYPGIGTQVRVYEWAQRHTTPDLGQVFWAGAGEVLDKVEILASVTGVVTKYEGELDPDPRSTGAGVLRRLKNKQSVKLLAVRIHPDSDEKLVWDYEVVE